MKIINLQDKNLFYIGGVVRDELLGRESFDIDLTYVGNAVEYAQTIPHAEILQINEPFGTVRIKLDGEEIDIASTRSETYPQKGHLPVVNKIGCPLKDDVLRRDFTINAMAKSTLTGEIVDYTGGLEDIKNKIIRVLHDKSFVDDPTRIVRALKFSVRFGFELEPHTKKLRDDYLKNINYDISYKRLKKELEETFNLNSQSAFEQFIKKGIYKLVTQKEFELPKVNLEQLINTCKPQNIWIIYAGLLPDISVLPLTKTEKKIVDDFQKLKTCKTLKTADDFEICKTFEDLNLETVIMYSSVDMNTVKKYLDKLRHIKPLVTGQDLLNLGIEPSIKYQECFDYILREKLKNPELDKIREIEIAKQFLEII